MPAHGSCGARGAAALASSPRGASATACRSGLFDATDGASAFALVAPALAAAARREPRGEALHARPQRARATTPRRRSRPRTSTGWSSCCARPSAREGDAPAAARRRRAATAGAAARSWPASLIGRGDVLTAERLLFKRTDERFERGLSPAEAHRVIGRRAARPIQADETIQEDMLE